MDNPLLVSVGSLIGVSGSILSYIMVGLNSLLTHFQNLIWCDARKCVAMNRSLTNVLFGGIASPVSADAHKIEGTITKTTVDDTVDALTNADSVILVKRTVYVFTQNQFIFSLRSLDMVWPSPRLSMPFQRLQQCYDPKTSMFECVRFSKD